MAYSPKSSPARIEAKLKAVEALKLRREGKSYAGIAEALGYRSQQAAWDAVDRLLTRTVKEAAEAVRTLELMRLDEMGEIHYLNAVAGDAIAAGVVLKIVEVRCKLLGLNAPMKQEITGGGGAALGAIVVPGVMTVEEWTAAAAVQQAALTGREVPEMADLDVR